jgi:hypothetical protein
MQAYWDFLLSALQSQFGKELGLLIAWLFCAAMFLLVAAPLYIAMKRATKLRDGRDTRRDLDIEPILGMQNRTQMSQPATDLLANANPTISYRTIVPPSNAAEVQSQFKTNSPSLNTRRDPAVVSAYMILTVVVMMIAGTVFALTRGANARVLLPFFFVVFAMFILRRAVRVRFSVRPGTNTNGTSIRRTLTTGEPLVVRLDNDAINKARLLLSTGKDLESVCRELEPGYGNWGSVQQRMFRKAMEKVLKMKVGP